MHSSRDTMQQQQQQQQQQTNGSLGDLQYYEITPTGRNDNSDNAPVPTTAHLHPINLCTVERLPASGIISQHQLQDILPGAVFADPSMAHLHYHIIPSPRRTLNCSDAGPQSAQGCRSHSRMEQVHLHEHHQHYQRQPKFVRPPSVMSEMAKERDRSSMNFDNLSRYSHLPHDKNEKSKNMSLAELTDSQATITGTKGGSNKCQCHAMHELRMKRDREAIGIAPEDDETALGQHRHPPALPPRPPPRPSGRRLDLPSVTAANQRHVGGSETGSGGSGCCKKYVVLCCLCGGLSAAVGSLFLAVHAVLSAHTASLALFETVPSYIPGTMLIFMGLFTMLLARRKHRYGFLMKVCGSVSVVCALVCVLVTVTTTVVHMSRLQGLRECVYTARARSCTCYGAPQSRASDPGVMFEGTPHCEVVHGALYACLRALFGVSVAGILACIFSCMLVYQLFSHEKKKMYWEQLELRCRSLYGQGAAGAGLVSARPAGTCGCCNDCAGIGPWWAQSPGNLYTPNPDLAPSRRWRLPWSRSRGPAPTTDSNYGFHGQAAAGAGSNPNQEALIDPTVGGIVPYSILGPQSAGAYSMLQAAHHEDHYGQNSAASPYSVLEAAVPLWGPPPPYSDPNSPARRPMIAFPQADPRTRLTKRMENFQREVDYGRTTSEIKRPSDNYENAEQVSNDTDTETSGNNVLSSARVARNNKQHKKLLKGVDNAGFQPQETNSMPKQSESELYFGDVSSCCGPESSLYDVATEKDGKSENCQAEAGTSSYHSSAHFPKRPSSKRSRRQQQQQQQQQHQQQLSSQQHDSSETVDMPRSNSSLSSSDDLPENAIVSYSVHTSTVDYDLIRQQRRYAGSQSSYSDKSPKEETHMTSEHREDSDDGAYGADEETEKKDNESEFKDFKDDYDEDMRPVKV